MRIATDKASAGLLNKRRREYPFLQTRGRLGCGRRWRSAGGGLLGYLPIRVSELGLNKARQFILPFSGNKSVVASHLEIAVAGDLRRFDGAAADLLPPSDIRSPERVRSEPKEIAAFGLGSLMESIADAGVPQRPSRRALLLEHERIRRGARRRWPLRSSDPTKSPMPKVRLLSSLLGRSMSWCQTRCSILIVAGVEIHVLPLQPEHFRDPRAGGNAGFDDQTVRLFEAGEHARGFVKRKNPALVLVAFLPEFRFADRAALALFPQTVTFGVVVRCGS